MKITLLTQYYPPEIGAPQARLSHLASRLVGAGHRVTVLTAMPNYPTGRIYPGYRGWMKRERDGLLEVQRTFVYPAQSAGFLPRLANYLSFVGSSAVLGSLFLESSDYLLVESPPLFLGLAGVWLSRLKRARLIFNVSDLWPESAACMGILRRNSRLYQWSCRLEEFCYRHAWLVTGQSQSIVENIARRFPAVPTRLLSNGADTEMFQPSRRTEAARARLTRNGEFVVLYAGLHGLAQGLSQALDAAALLQHENEKGYRFVFVGDGPQKRELVQKAQAICGAVVTFLDPLPAHEIPALLAAADLVLVPLATTIPGAVPSKLYEAMASGRATVLIAEGEAAEIVRRHQAGLVVQPRDIAGLAQAVRKVRSHPGRARSMGENARAAALQHFDRGRIAQSFVSYLEAQASGPPVRMENAENSYEAPLRA